MDGHLLGIFQHGECKGRVVVATLGCPAEALPATVPRLEDVKPGLTVVRISKKGSRPQRFGQDAFETGGSSNLPVFDCLTQAKKATVIPFVREILFLSSFVRTAIQESAGRDVLRHGVKRALAALADWWPR